MGLASVIIMIVLVSADRLTKYYAVKLLQPIETIPVIDGIFSLTYTENTGAAFGMFQGARWIFVVITIAILILMTAYYIRLPKQKPYIYLRLCLLLIASGAVGNLIDRVRTGSVVDFLQFIPFNFPVFNLADCFVCIGAFSMSFLLIFVIKD